ncbi:uncharacterized protein LOC135197011 [Macrobrachium nipponense]|uniref:uncharacterized protein LOC135197011 n=1 Tax=Macrobrachium nipponense TaxID=159736 RepID=UPI0030C828CD
MGKERIQGLLLFMAFVLVLSFAVLVTSTVYPRGTGGGCEDKESCLLSPTLGRIELVREASLVIIAEKHKSVRKHHLKQWPTNEEWTAIIEALGNNEQPEYVANHGLTVQQIQNGSYDYSYGNDGIYHSKMYGKIHTNGNRGHAASMYFQMATGKTGTPSLHYESGFVTLSQIHFLQGRGTAQWKGKAQGAFFNKNHDGSYTVFALATGTVKGSSKAISRTTMQVTESMSSTMNATSFTAQSHSAATTNFTFNGKDNDMASTSKMFIKVSNKSPGTTETSTSNKTLMFRGYANGEYPRYGPGDYVTSYNATISGSILNSTLVTYTRGHTWITYAALSPAHSATLHHLNFLI